MKNCGLIYKMLFLIIFQKKFLIYRNFGSGPNCKEILNYSPNSKEILKDSIYFQWNSGPGFWFKEVLYKVIGPKMFWGKFLSQRSCRRGSSLEVLFICSSFKYKIFTLFVLVTFIILNFIMNFLLPEGSKILYCVIYLFIKH